MFVCVRKQAACRRNRNPKFPAACVLCPVPGDPEIAEAFSCFQRNAVRSQRESDAWRLVAPPRTPSRPAGSAVETKHQEKQRTGDVYAQMVSRFVSLTVGLCDDLVSG